jgi:hypothetical protein
MDQAHRIGQMKHVYVFRFIAEEQRRGASSRACCAETPFGSVSLPATVEGCAIVCAGWDIAHSFFILASLAINKDELMEMISREDHQYKRRVRISFAIHLIMPNLRGDSLMINDDINAIIQCGTSS